MAFETQFEPSAKGQGGTIPLTDPRDGGVMAGHSGLSLLCLAGIVTLMQWLQGLNSDTSWLVTVAEHWRDGSRPYVDILESNPPASVLSLMPAVWLAKWTGIPVALIVIAGTSLAAVVAIELSLALAPASGSRAHSAAYRLISGFALLILPVSIFAEREHFAVIALWPMTRAMLLRAQGEGLSWPLRLVAGLGAGIAMAFKPQFAVLILLPAIGVAVIRRDLRSLFAPEYWVAGGFVALYGLGVSLFLPAYFQIMVPLVVEFYVPIREPIVTLLTNEVMPWLALSVIGLIVVTRDRLRDPAILLPLLAGVGGLVMVLQQAKGFGYHYYPLAAAIVPALCGEEMIIADARLAPGTPKPARVPIVLGFLAIASGLVGTTLGFYGPSRPLAPLAEPILARYSHPRMMAINAHFWIGQPLTRDVGGLWVGSVPNDWMTLGALYRLGLGVADATERARLSAAIEADKARSAADIARQQPDVILVERDDRILPAWFGSEQELERFLAGYTRIATLYDVVEVWSRKR